jgi:hypothetical protein
MRFAVYRQKCLVISRHMVAFPIGFTTYKLVAKTLKKKDKGDSKMVSVFSEVTRYVEWRVGVSLHAFFTSGLDGSEWSASRPSYITQNEEAAVPNL